MMTTLALLLLLVWSSEMSFDPSQVDLGPQGSLAFPWFKKDTAFPSPATLNPSAPLEDLLKRSREFLGEKEPDSGGVAVRQAAQGQAPGASPQVLTGFQPGPGAAIPQPPELLTGGPPPPLLGGATVPSGGVPGGPDGAGGTGGPGAGPSGASGGDWQKFLGGGLDLTKRLAEGLRGGGIPMSDTSPEFTRDPNVPPGDFDPGFTDPTLAAQAPSMDTTEGAAAGFEPASSGWGLSDVAGAAGVAGAAARAGMDLANPNLKGSDKATALMHDVVRGAADYAGAGIPSLIDQLAQLLGAPSGAQVWMELFGNSGPETTNPLVSALQGASDKTAFSGDVMGNPDMLWAYANTFGKDSPWNEAYQQLYGPKDFGAAASPNVDLSGYGE